MMGRAIVAGVHKQRNQVSNEKIVILRVDQFRNHVTT
jgi:hypothetical protein